MTDTDKLTLLRAGTLPKDAAEWVEGIIAERDAAIEANREAYVAGTTSGWNAALNAAIADINAYQGETWKKLADRIRALKASQ